MALDDVEWYAFLSKQFDINHVLSMPFEFAVKAIKHSIEQNNERRVWEQWLTIYPHMNKDNFISFEDFYEKLKGNVDTRSTHDLLAEFDEIAALMRGE